LLAEQLGNQRRGNVIGTKRVSLAVVVDPFGRFARLWASSRSRKISASIVVLLRFSVQPFCRRDAVGGSRFGLKFGWELAALKAIANDYWLGLPRGR
jgi:hypothetical protein